MIEDKLESQHDDPQPPLMPEIETYRSLDHLEMIQLLTEIRDALIGLRGDVNDVICGRRQVFHR